MFTPDCARLHPSETAYKILIYWFGAFDGVFACFLGGRFSFVLFCFVSAGYQELLPLSYSEL